MPFITFPSDKIGDLMRVLQSGIRFYRDGINAVKCGSTREMFSRMLEEKQQACKELRPYVQPVKGSESTLSVEARKLYTGLISRVLVDREQAFIDQLASLERRILFTFDEALKEKQSQSCALLLRKIRTRMLQCHEELVALKTVKKMTRDRV